MSSDPHKSKRCPPDDKQGSSLDKSFEDKAVETFVLEVTAGKPSEASNAIVDKHTPTSAESNHSLPGVPGSTAQAASGSRGSRRRKPQRPTAATIHQNKADRATVYLRRYFRNLSSIGVSLLLHVIALLLLSLFVLAIPSQDDDLGLYASAAPAEEALDFSEIEIDPTENLEEMEEDLSADMIDPGASSFGELSAESALSNMASDTSAMSDILGDVGTLFGEEGQGLAELGIGKGGAMASFFGARVEAKRILYMLDNSGSMHSGRLETMIFEMIKSVDALNQKQQFFVIFYSDTVYPLFFPQPATEFVRATKKNKQRLRQWLDTVEMYPGNAVDEAIRAAAVIRPDVVYFLTDGDVNTTKDGRKLQALLDTTGRSFTIHTFGMGTGNNAEHEENLMRIAEANGGTYRNVDVPPAMKELAKKNPRMYHKKKSK